MQKIQPFGKARLIHRKLGKILGLHMNLLVITIKIGTRDEPLISRLTTNVTQILGEKSKDWGNVKQAPKNSSQSV